MSNYLMGAGRLYFDPLVSGAYEGERYLGQSPGFSISTDAERVQLFSSDGPTAEKLEDVVTQINRSASFSLNELNLENIALFFAGATAATSQAGGTVTNEAVNGGDGVKQGRWYQLGVSANFPAGVRSISSVTVKTTAETPVTVTAEGNYELDLVLGRLYITPGGDIDNDDTITIDYTSAAKAWDTISSGNLASRQGRMRYIEDATRGTQRDFFFPKVDLAPNGDFELKSRDTFAELPFTLEILKPDVGQAIVITSRPV